VHCVNDRRKTQFASEMNTKDKMCKHPFFAFDKNTELRVCTKSMDGILY